MVANLEPRPSEPVSGVYYLHTNGNLIFKRRVGDDNVSADMRDSDFVRAFWPVSTADRASAWHLLVEATALSANADQVRALAAKWGCDNNDALEYASRVRCSVFPDERVWCATRLDFINVQESPCGFGDTALEAMGAMAKELGYTGQRLWGATFASLLA